MVLRCRCGAIGLQVAGDPIAQFFCHCDDCQAVYGGAYAPEAVYPAADVTVVGGEPKVWTYKRNPRMTCADCGTRLFIDVPAMKLRGINGFLLPPGTFRPTFHMHCRFAVRPIVDGLPHFAGKPTRFGGTDDLIAW